MTTATAHTPPSPPGARHRAPPPDWMRFGQHGTVAANDPVEQEKDPKFTSLLANLMIFHDT